MKRVWHRATFAAGLLAALVLGHPAHARDDAPAAAACSRTTGPAGIDAARWSTTSDAAALTRPGTAVLRFRARDGNELAVHVHRPASFQPQEGPIWFVMHGHKRAADIYARDAAASADQYGALVVAIEFPARLYPGSDSYTLGVVTSGKPNERALREGRWRQPADYLYNEVERVFEAVRSQIGGRQRGYFMFGHSAGAQFTHRMVTFVPCARVLGAVAANSGWYTMPDFDAAHGMPYSLKGTPLREADQRALLAAPLTVLLGTEDTRTPEEDADVRGTPGALAQGPNRLARGQNYFDTGRKLADRLRTPFGWHVVLAPGAGHSDSQVVASAARILFGRAGESFCEPETGAAPGAVALKSVRPDASVEIVNKASRSLCLTGWTVQAEGSRKQRVVPIGPPLAAGETFVLPGDGSHVRGGVLILRDPNGREAGRLSWGDCGRRCSRAPPFASEPSRDS